MTKPSGEGAVFVRTPIGVHGGEEILGYDRITISDTPRLMSTPHRAFWVVDCVVDVRGVTKYVSNAVSDIEEDVANGWLKLEVS